MCVCVHTHVCGMYTKYTKIKVEQNINKVWINDAFFLITVYDSSLILKTCFVSKISAVIQKDANGRSCTPLLQKSWVKSVTDS